MFSLRMRWVHSRYRYEDPGGSWTTLRNGRKDKTRCRGLRRSYQWHWARSCNVFEWCRVELPLTSASIRRPSLSIFHPKYSGASDKVLHDHFCFLKKRWPRNRTAEPEVPAVPPLRHLPSVRKSRWHPSLRPSPAEPSCLRPAGSIRCPTISGCTKS